MKLDLDALQALAKAATAGPWEYDTEKNEGDYGAGPDCSSGFDSYVIHDGKGQTLFDSLNSNAAVVQEDYDEDHFRAWDEVAERNAKFIAAASPQTVLALIDRLRKAEAEASRLNTLINTPELQDFARGVVLESVHQRERWGTESDDGKTAADWFWLIGYLAQKAMMHQLAGETDKAMHHTITTAAALANWHTAIIGACNRMRPGIAAPDSAESEGEKG